MRVVCNLFLNDLLLLQKLLKKRFWVCTGSSSRHFFISITFSERELFLFCSINPASEKAQHIWKISDRYFMKHLNSRKISSTGSSRFNIISMNVPGPCATTCKMSDHHTSTWGRVVDDLHTLLQNVFRQRRNDVHIYCSFVKMILTISKLCKNVVCEVRTNSVYSFVHQTAYSYDVMKRCVRTSLSIKIRNDF